MTTSPSETPPPPGPRRKWRPSLAMVLGGALAGTLGISFIGLLILREFGPEFGFWTVALPIGAMILLLTAAMGLVLGRLLLRPIRALARYAGEVRQARATATAPPERFGTVELGDMAASVIEMAEALRAREATMRSYSDHVTHELKSPVSVVVAASELLQDRPLAEADRALVDQIAGAAAQMHQQLDALRMMARARSADYRGRTTLEALRAPLSDRHNGLDLRLDGVDVSLPMSAPGLSLVLDHLLFNAAEHGAAQVRLSAAPGLLRIADDGPGIAPGNRTRVFDPFFTTKREIGGTGMGLAISANILAAHGAEISVLDLEIGDGSSALSGAIFEIRFTPRRL
ncbi:MAG: HAMP domain-containing sensor histidine kinase [Pseudomonadota bacterium]